MKKARKTKKGKDWRVRVVNSLPHSDLLPRPRLRGHRFPWFYRHLSSVKRAHSIAKLGGIVKTLRIVNLPSGSIFSMAGSFGFLWPKMARLGFRVGFRWVGGVVLLWKMREKGMGFGCGGGGLGTSKGTGKSIRTRLSKLPFMRTGKNNKLNFLWPKMARLGPPFLAQKSPGKSLCGSLFCVLSQEMRHINFLLGAQNGVFCWVGAKKFMLKKFMCFLCPHSLALISSSRTVPQP